MHLCALYFVLGALLCSRNYKEQSTKNKVQTSLSSVIKNR
jgi:hypothetical protein